MQNLFELIKEGLHYNKFEVGDNIAVEYSCPLEEEQMDRVDSSAGTRICRKGRRK